MGEKQSEKQKKVEGKQNAESKKDIQESLLKVGFVSEEEFNKEREQWKKRLAYALAEQENLKKNAQKEIEKVRDFAILDLVKEILVSVESLEKAVAHMLEHNVEGPVFEGSKLTLDAIFSALKKNGIEKIEAKGTRFDHNLHQAVSTVKAADLPNNTVFEVLQDGYTIKGRLLRPAVVVVVDNFE
ncbi:co-chaperone GrpE [Neorickettsia risticii str. Illinois]|uniref:Protein GrpE n=1 Tax=Neorickettsia risticii (strain Illinois) TaxID=434131 RepID=C6V480_NEORI|nr:nucleotide exchange factor GrpE [Neorickettsia risticii]ACT69196.1 co-chaperone GrpE [Neorickettsia risticii str. Illinois]